MQEVGVHQHLWLEIRHVSSNYFKLATPYVLTREENKSFIEFVFSI